MNSKPIETIYNGHRFRSRLEARWAVWLDTLGIKYAYELQGFNLDGIPYLPDFWLPFPSGRAWPSGTPPHAGYWLEIKPAPLTDDEERLLSLLAQHTKHHAHAFAGDPWPGDFARYVASLQGGDVEFFPPTLCPMCKGAKVVNVVPYECKWRGKAYTAVGSMPCHCQHSALEDIWLQFELRGFLHNFFDVVPDLQVLKTAFERARSARFEHGESP
jgi:hypothetical protein